MSMDEITKKNVDKWLNGHYDEATKATIRKLLQENPKEIVDAFYTSLSFGTAGMRGLMGVGCNRINQYTIEAASQGLATYIKQQEAPPQGHAVFIGYDSRINSRFFAEQSAKVLAANGIRVYLCKELRPTPFVSFGCRYKQCTAAIMVTASHNPAEYNGYKVYWSDGGQVLPPHDIGIISAFKAITDTTQVSKLDTLHHPLIEWVNTNLDERYLEAISSLQKYPEENHNHGAELSIVYTALHGTGMTLMPQAFSDWGFTNVHYVTQQAQPNGNFPTVQKPNPEDPEALKLGIEMLEKVNGDILIATDPDADRVAIAVRHEGKVQLLNGNQIACLCLYHICKALINHKALPQQACFIKTIVTTEMFQAICDSFSRPCYNVLPGFKYIAELIRNWEHLHDRQFLFAAEESYGYLQGTQVRDKDAISSSVLLCELALQAKLQNKTLIDLMEELNGHYGFYIDKVVSWEFEESKVGHDQILCIMKRLRTNPPHVMNNARLKIIADYETQLKTDVQTGGIEKLQLPSANILQFWFEDGSKIIVRPSGTEPKLKLYCEVKLKGFHEDAINIGRQRIDSMVKALANIVE